MLWLPGLFCWNTIHKTATANKTTSTEEILDRYALVSFAHFISVVQQQQSSGFDSANSFQINPSSSTKCEERYNDETSLNWKINFLHKAYSATTRKFNSLNLNELPLA